MGDAPAAGAKPPRASEIIERISTEQDFPQTFPAGPVGKETGVMHPRRSRQRRKPVPDPRRRLPGNFLGVAPKPRSARDIYLALKCGVSWFVISCSSSSDLPGWCTVRQSPARGCPSTTIPASVKYRRDDVSPRRKTGLLFVSACYRSIRPLDRP